MPTSEGSIVVRIPVPLYGRIAKIIADYRTEKTVEKNLGKVVDSKKSASA